MENKLQNKPQGRSSLVVVFKCDTCDEVNTVRENYEEFSDCGDGDSLDHYCSCGSYFKKIYDVTLYCNVIESYYKER